MNDKKKLFVLVFIAIMSFGIAKASSLSSIEKQISQYAKEHVAEQLSFLSTLVNINSGTDNLPGIYKVGELLRAQFDLIGFKTRWVDEPKYMQRAPTLIAEHKGKKGKKILLIGHLDTVFPKDSVFQEFKRHGNLAKGPGVIDDKGGDVVILSALKALQTVHALDDATITIVLTGDEEASGKPTAISRKPLINAASNADVALDFECALSSDTATVGRRGIANWKIETQGISTHSASIFQKSVGDGAIFELARILNTMRTELQHEKYLTFNPGFILGGSTIHYDKENFKGSAFGKENIIAQSALATGDLRFLTPKQKTNAQKKITSIVNHHLLNTKASVVFEDGIPSMAPTPGNLGLLKKYSQASIDLGYGPVKALDPGLRGAGDISYVTALIPANLAGLGPVGWSAHSVNETLDVSSLHMQTARAALLIYRLVS